VLTTPTTSLPPPSGATSRPWPEPAKRCRNSKAAAAPSPVATLAAKAGISRAWVYTETELHQQINALRGPRLNTPQAAGTVERSSDTSLRHRLALAHQRISELTDDSHQLRDQIARLHGQLRTAKLGRPVADSVHDTNAQLTSPTRSSGYR